MLPINGTGQTFPPEREEEQDTKERLAKARSRHSRTSMHHIWHLGLDTASLGL